MYKPWPKCPDCNLPMSLSRRTSQLEDIVEVQDNGFVCEHCPPKARRSPPTTPKTAL